MIADLAEINNWPIYRPIVIYDLKRFQKVIFRLYYSKFHMVSNDFLKKQFSDLRPESLYGYLSG